MRIYFVRHGITANHEGDKKRSQSPDTPLSPTGKRQARRLAKKLKKLEIPFDVMFVSPFARTKQTAEVISNELGVSYEEMETIHEKLTPSYLWGLGSHDPVFAEYLSELKMFWEDMDWKYKGEGESIRDVLARAQKFEDHLISSHLGQNVLVVSHGLFGRCFIASCVLGKKAGSEAFMRLFQAIKTENTGLTLLEYEEENKKWSIRFLNDHSHLM